MFFTILIPALCFTFGVTSCIQSYFLTQRQMVARDRLVMFWI